MVERFATPDKIVGVKIETTPGTDPTPTVAANAVRIMDPSLDYDAGVDSGENEATGSIDAGTPIPLGLNGKFTGAVRLRGSGTGGTAPDFGALLRACAMAEDVATLAADESGTAQAGSAATITLAASGPSATNDVYIGAVITTTGGTGSGQTRVITDYVGSTKVATVSPAWDTQPAVTTTYTIYAAALYAPCTADQETVTIYEWLNALSASTNSKLSKLHGVNGTFGIDVANRGIGKINFDMVGLAPATPQSDVTRPTGLVLTTAEARPFQGADAYLDDTAFQFSTLQLGYNGQVVQPDDPSAANGLDYGSVLKRAFGGTIRANSRLKANRDVLTDFQAGTGRKLWLRWGTVAGERVSILMPGVRYVRPARQTSNNGFNAEDIQFRANGLDTGLYLNFY